MGRVYEYFKDISLSNEADVNQNFVLPFLTKFLGYSLSDIKPEREFPAKDIFYGKSILKSTKELKRSQRPDFLICIDDVSEIKYIIESKGPNEKLDDHLKQLVSYALGVGVNILVITNGAELQIYDVNILLLKSDNLEDIDIKFQEIYKILSKENQINFELIEIIKNIDFQKSLRKIDPNENQKRLLKISDFLQYLHFIKTKYCNWQSPIEVRFFNDLEIEAYSPIKLHWFQLYEPSSTILVEKKIFKYSELESKYKTSTIIIIGTSGIGKTTLLKYLLYKTVCETLELTETIIPVYIQLRHYSSGQNIEKLIINSFLQSGYHINEDQWRMLLTKNHFLFLFDAFDEVQRTYHQNIISEIEELKSIGNHHIVITTRENATINISNSTKFIITPLENEEIENLIDKYLGVSKYKFISEIKKKGFNQELKNTLLLTFLIVAYKETNDLPNSRFKIIANIIGKLKKWENKKADVFEASISWEIKEEILEELAYELIDSTNSFILNKKQIDKILIPLLNKFEKDRMISSSLDKFKILEQLYATGIIYESDDGVSFWHRVFVSYFAAKALYNRGSKDYTIYEERIPLLKWSNPISGSANYFENPSKLVSMILKNNFILATHTILENENVDLDIITQITDRLVIECSSELFEIRMRSLNLLKLLPHKYTLEIFYNLLQKNSHLEVRMQSLIEIAKNGSQRTKDTVYNLLTWDEGGFPNGTTQGAIATALSYFEETEHLKILDILESKPDIFTTGSCSEALLEVVKSGKASKRLKDELLLFYLRDRSKDEFIDKYRSISEALKEFNDYSFITALINNMEECKNGNDYYKHIIVTAEILASYKSPEAIEKLFINAQTNKSILVRQVCAKALKESKAVVLLEKIIQLLDDTEALVRRYAIECLQKYEFVTIKKYLLKHLNDNDARVQSSVIELLAEFGQLSLLLNNEYFPQKFYKLSFETLLNNIARYKLYELLKIVDDILQKNLDERLQIKIAKVYLICDTYEKGKAIVNNIVNKGLNNIEQFSIIDLLELAPHLKNPDNVILVKEILKTISQGKFSSSYWEDKCIESLEQINDYNAKCLLKELAQKYVNVHHIVLIERVLRSLNNISAVEDEEWYISFIVNNPCLKGFDLRRAIEGLGIIGGVKSLPIIKVCFKSNSNNGFIKDTCFISYQNILRSNGEFVVINENELNN